MPARTQPVLRPWRRGDGPALSRAIAESAEHLRPWMPWVAAEPKTEAQREAFIEAAIASEEDPVGDRIAGLWIGRQVVGGFGLHRRIGPGGIELGYWLHPGFTGRGLATQACRDLVDLAFLLPEVEYVEIHHDRANDASRGIPLRLGFAHVEDRPDPPQAPGDEGIECVWRLERPVLPPRRARAA